MAKKMIRRPITQERVDYGVSKKKKKITTKIQYPLNPEMLESVESSLRMSKKKKSAETVVMTPKSAAETEGGHRARKRKRSLLKNENTVESSSKKRKSKEMGNKAETVVMTPKSGAETGGGHRARKRKRSSPKNENTVESSLPLSKKRKSKGMGKKNTDDDPNLITFEQQMSTLVDIQESLTSLAQKLNASTECIADLKRSLKQVDNKLCKAKRSRDWSKFITLSSEKKEIEKDLRNKDFIQIFRSQNKRTREVQYVNLHGLGTKIAMWIFRLILRFNETFQFNRVLVFITGKGGKGHGPPSIKRAVNSFAKTYDLDCVEYKRGLFRVIIDDIQRNYTLYK